MDHDVRIVDRVPHLGGQVPGPLGQVGVGEQEESGGHRASQLHLKSRGGGYGPTMTTDEPTRTDDVVAESALQLWSAAQTDFDPFEVDSSDWPETAVPVRDADIAVDTHLELDDVRAALGRLDGVKVVVGREAGTVSVLRVIPEDVPL
ncbi:hypothetical protein GCM10011376_16730 [Nocardioides flavus (ex Wang et al. 2016)]|uniref:Uncharacterized protein n=2 Tax=Nocardioides flavus (ex Wang et al. 2016) TaxID=2058780 RepID=A0ABQ3HHE4_9ACTN|nr:hypothetical protein GCM10011376_16730 [Nocardioides flavus (ex Wang et al. 2016)]